ncbi:MAG: 5-(carboxyamino)imidazole ribonucleotide synthase [Chloroflexota bacterium]|nr:5-(carboxyamino)imidazole ribonucleotide synthase [Chloroflexota bacterium]
MHKTILPGATIGVFGSGQLGRMFTLAARRLGYRIHTFSPDADSPTGQVADREVCASYEDWAAVRRFVRGVDVVTFEFENVAATIADIAAEAGVPVRPGGWVLHTAQHRLREKQFLAAAGLPITPFAPVHTLTDLQHGLERLGCPTILKTATFGYDGKGQININRVSEAEAAWQVLNTSEAVLEARVDFVGEFSVVAARSLDGSFAHYGVIENRHRNHILETSLAPARVAASVAAGAITLAQTVLEKLDVVGVLCVEFFLTHDGQWLINELAPRPHNSGHLTVDAAVTNQFEQQVRAVCGLPLGSTTLLRPAAMINLLGDLWAAGEPDWAAGCAFPAVKLHLYGKHAARPGRKMGHLTALASTGEQALQMVQAAHTALLST